MMREYRQAILFLVRYVLVYVVLNTAYGYYVKCYTPDADPVTIIATQHAQWMLALFDDEITTGIVAGSADVPLLKDGSPVMTVYEGCNGINVMIVFVAFIIAFRGPFKLFIQYLCIGLLFIYALNLLRLMALYGVALYFPGSFYFSHKFFFTGVLYAAVFALWYLWVTRLKRWKSEEVSMQG